MPQVGMEPIRLVAIDVVPIYLDRESGVFTITPLGRVKSIPG